jgi:hypothetical protein
MREKVCLLESYEGKPLYFYKFNYADDYKDNQDNEKAFSNVNNIIKNFVDSTC